LTNRPEGSINPASSRNLKPPALAGGVFTSLVEGAKVSFDIVQHKGKEAAENLKLS
jgi:hypothetical protein